ncbi:MAG TPA: hypothetical protein VE619_05005, partial [Nitrososphaeraceae archaeon]|nr:hypothetical protein [Nitrososphaeraceae archaeon]
MSSGLKSIAMNFQSHKRIVLVAIPLVLSAFTHLFNPIGFPSIDHDEGHYMRRAMEVIDGLGPQESRTVFPNPIDHPYFGQLFLAGALKIVGYPSSLNLTALTATGSSNNVAEGVHANEMLWLVPRILMGLLAIADTFLIYKIAERRYNATVALIASVLFAVMPLSWMTRRIFLESIQLPVILSSVLAAIYLIGSKESKKNAAPEKRPQDSNFNFNPYNSKILVLTSGIFLGLAIFTKIPAIAMIPVVGFLIYTNIGYTKNSNNSGSKIRRILHPNRRNIKMLALWFIPVILIPIIWPLYSISVGYSFGYWLDRVVYQGTRLGQAPLQAALRDDFSFDPIFIILGLTGLAYAAVKRDFFLILWAVPFLIFLYEVHWVMPFHIVPLFPV